jgi:hypothetical protein
VRKPGAKGSRRVKTWLAIFLTILSGAMLGLTSCAAAFDKTFSMTRQIPTPRIFVAGMLVGAAAFVGGIIWLVVATIMGIVRMYRNRWQGFN